jgi:hypothetical protein
MDGHGMRKCFSEENRVYPAQPKREHLVDGKDELGNELEKGNHCGHDRSEKKSLANIPDEGGSSSRKNIRENEVQRRK